MQLVQEETSNKLLNCAFFEETVSCACAIWLSSLI